MKKQAVVKKTSKKESTPAKKAVKSVANSKATLTKKAPQPAKEAVTGKKKTGSSALRAASLGRSATAQVGRHSDRDLATTGTNISYEGATAPGSGGSVGSGYASGKEAVEETIHTDSDYAQSEMLSPDKKKKAAVKSKK